MEKKDAARVLFLEGITGTEIAKILGTRDATVSKWAIEGDWKSQRTKKKLNDQTREDNVLDLIDYQLFALKALKDDFQEKVDNGAVDDNGEPILPTLIPSGAIDGLQKLFTTIKRSEMKWSDVVKVMREYTEYLNQYDADLAKLNINYIEMFLNDKRKS